MSMASQAIQFLNHAFVKMKVIRTCSSSLTFSPLQCIVWFVVVGGVLSHLNPMHYWLYYAHLYLSIISSKE